jgi:hypothetical protein
MRRVRYIICVILVAHAASFAIQTRSSLRRLFNMRGSDIFGADPGPDGQWSDPVMRAILSTHLMMTSSSPRGEGRQRQILLRVMAPGTGSFAAFLPGLEKRKKEK